MMSNQRPSAVSLNNPGVHSTHLDRQPAAGLVGASTTPSSHPEYPNHLCGVTDHSSPIGSSATQNIPKASPHITLHGATTAAGSVTHGLVHPRTSSNARVSVSSPSVGPVSNPLANPNTASPAFDHQSTPLMTAENAPSGVVISARVSTGTSNVIPKPVVGSSAGRQLLGSSSRPPPPPLTSGTPNATPAMTSQAHPHHSHASHQHQHHQYEDFDEGAGLLGNPAVPADATTAMHLPSGGHQQQQRVSRMSTTSNGLVGGMLDSLNLRQPSVLYQDSAASAAGGAGANHGMIMHDGSGVSSGVVLAGRSSSSAQQQQQQQAPEVEFGTCSLQNSLAQLQVAASVSDCLHVRQQLESFLQSVDVQPHLATAQAFERSFVKTLLQQTTLLTFKVYPCRIRGSHDRKTCPFHHGDRDRRRVPFRYSSEICSFATTQGGGTCPEGDKCPLSHNRLEVIYHPSTFKRRFCAQYPDVDECVRGCFCAFAHHRSEKLGELFSEEEEANRTEVFFMSRFKTLWCPFGVQHDWHACLYAHTFQDCRRSLEAGYGSEPCPSWEKNVHLSDYTARCERGFACPYSHGSKEQLYHPCYFRTMPCADYRANHGSCPRGELRAFYHASEEKRVTIADTHLGPGVVPQKAGGEEVIDMSLLESAEGQTAIARGPISIAAAARARVFVFRSIDYTQPLPHIDPVHGTIAPSALLSLPSGSQSLELHHPHAHNRPSGNSILAKSTSATSSPALGPSVIQRDSTSFDNIVATARATTQQQQQQLSHQQLLLQTHGIGFGPSAVGGELPNFDVFLQYSHAMGSSGSGNNAAAVNNNQGANGQSPTDTVPLAAASRLLHSIDFYSHFAASSSTPAAAANRHASNNSNHGVVQVSHGQNHSSGHHHNSQGGNHGNSNQQQQQQHISHNQHHNQRWNQQTTPGTNNNNNNASNNNNGMFENPPAMQQTRSMHHPIVGRPSPHLDHSHAPNQGLFAHMGGLFLNNPQQQQQPHGSLMSNASGIPQNLRAASNSSPFQTHQGVPGGNNAQQQQQHFVQDFSLPPGASPFLASSMHQPFPGAHPHPHMQQQQQQAQQANRSGYPPVPFPTASNANPYAQQMMGPGANNNPIGQSIKSMNGSGGSMMGTPLVQPISSPFVNTAQKNPQGGALGTSMGGGSAYNPVGSPGLSAGLPATHSLGGLGANSMLPPSSQSVGGLYDHHHMQQQQQQMHAANGGFMMGHPAFGGQGMGGLFGMPSLQPTTSQGGLYDPSMGNGGYGAPSMPRFDSMFDQMPWGVHGNNGNNNDAGNNNVNGDMNSSPYGMLMHQMNQMVNNGNAVSNNNQQQQSQQQQQNVLQAQPQHSAYPPGMMDGVDGEDSAAVGIVKDVLDAVGGAEE